MYFFNKSENWAVVDAILERWGYDIVKKTITQVLVNNVNICCKFLKTNSLKIFLCKMFLCIWTASSQKFMKQKYFFTSIISAFFFFWCTATFVLVSCTVQNSSMLASLSLVILYTKYGDENQNNFLHICTRRCKNSKLYVNKLRPK